MYSTIHSCNLLVMISKKMLSKKRKKQFYSIVRDSKHLKFKLAVSVPPNVDVSSKSTKLSAVYAYFFILGSYVDVCSRSTVQNCQLFTLTFLSLGAMYSLLTPVVLFVNLIS